MRSALRARLEKVTRAVEVIPAWRYHLEKIGHTAALGLIVAAFGATLALGLAVVGALYLVVGKAVAYRLEPEHFGDLGEELRDFTMDGWLGSAPALLVVASPWGPLALAGAVLLWTVVYVALIPWGRP